MVQPTYFLTALAIISHSKKKVLVKLFFSVRNSTIAHYGSSSVPLNNHIIHAACVNFLVVVGFSTRTFL